MYILLMLSTAAAFSQPTCLKNAPLGNLWENVGDAGFSAGQAYYTSLAFNPADGKPYVAYVDIPAGSNAGPASVMKFDGTGWVYVGTPGFTIVTVGYTSLAFSPEGEPLLAFAAGCSSSLQACVMKFNGVEWVYVGGGGFSHGTADFTSLACWSGLPYVAYTDLTISNKTCVMKFTGTNWESVGSPGFSAGESWYNHLAFSPSGVPYVAFLDFTNGQKEIVMKFDGNNWVNAGDPGFSPELQDVGFAINPANGQPYLAFMDPLNSHRATVKRFDGNNWVVVGDGAFSIDYTTRICIAFNPLAEPVVSYWDAGLPGYSVKKFNGTQWVNVGNTAFTADYLDYPSFAINVYGEPCLAYMDEGNSMKASVMKYTFPTGIQEQKAQGLSVFPNPATTDLTVDFNQFESHEKSLEVYDAQGKMVKSFQTLQNRVTLNIGDYPAGIYLVKVRSVNFDYSTRFCKN